MDLFIFPVDVAVRKGFTVAPSPFNTCMNLMFGLSFNQSLRSVCRLHQTLEVLVTSLDQRQSLEIKVPSANTDCSCKETYR